MAKALGTPSRVVQKELADSAPHSGAAYTMDLLRLGRTGELRDVRLDLVMAAGCCIGVHRHRAPRQVRAVLTGKVTPGLMSVTGHRPAAALFRIGSLLVRQGIALEGPMAHGPVRKG